jgi:hypothetical protein
MELTCLDGEPQGDTYQGGVRWQLKDQVRRRLGQASTWSFFLRVRCQRMTFRSHQHSKMAKLIARSTIRRRAEHVVDGKLSAGFSPINTLNHQTGSERRMSTKGPRLGGRYTEVYWASAFPGVVGERIDRQSSQRSDRRCRVDKTSSTIASNGILRCKG